MKSGIYEVKRVCPECGDVNTLTSHGILCQIKYMLKHVTKKHVFCVHCGGNVLKDILSVRCKLKLNKPKNMRVKIKWRCNLCYSQWEVYRDLLPNENLSNVKSTGSCVSNICKAKSTDIRMIFVGRA